MSPARAKGHLYMLMTSDDHDAVITTAAASAADGEHDDIDDDDDDDDDMMMMMMMMMMMVMHMMMMPIYDAKLHEEWDIDCNDDGPDNERQAPSLVTRPENTKSIPNAICEFQPRF